MHVPGWTEKARAVAGMVNGCAAAHGTASSWARVEAPVRMWSCSLDAGPQSSRHRARQAMVPAGCLISKQLSRRKNVGKASSITRWRMVSYFSSVEADSAGNTRTVRQSLLLLLFAESRCGIRLSSFWAFLYRRPRETPCGDAEIAEARKRTDSGYPSGVESRRRSHPSAPHTHFCNTVASCPTGWKPNQR